MTATIRGNKFRVAHLVSHPIQYFAPLYRSIEDRNVVDLHVFFYSDATLRTYHDREFGREVSWEADLAAGYRSHIVRRSSERPIPCGPRDAVRPDIYRAVMALRADVLWLHAYHLPTSLALAYTFIAMGRPVVLRGEQTLVQEASPVRRRAKNLVLSPLVRRARSAFIGDRNREYLEHHGAHPRDLFFAPYSVPGAPSRPSRDAARRELGLDPTRPVVLFVGKLVARKEPLRLLEAWSSTVDAVRSTLLYAGDGPLRSAVEDAAEAHGGDSVTVTGFLSDREMPLAYAAADIFVLPSTSEPWGLVVNEALMAGLPVVVGDKVGSAADLVVDGWNGHVVDPSDPVALAAALSDLLLDLRKCGTWGERGRARVREYSLDRTTDGLIAAFVGDQSLAPAHHPVLAGADVSVGGNA